MYACMTPVGFDTSDKFENHCSKVYYFTISLYLHLYRPTSAPHISLRLINVVITSLDSCQFC